MADFASVFQLANRPTVALESYGDAMGKALQLKSLQQQTQMGGMQAQQLEQQISDAAELRNTLKTSASLDDALTKAQKLGSPAAQGFIKNALEMKEKGVKLSADQFKLANDHLAKVGQDVVGAANSPGITPQALAAMIQNHAQQGNIPPAQAQEMIGEIPQNPAEIPLWGRLQATKLGTAPDILKMFTPATHFTGGVAAKVDPMTGSVLATERVKGYSDTPHPGIGPDGKPGFMQLDENGKVPAGWRPMPPASGGAGHGGGGVTPSGSSDDIALAFIQGRRKTPTGRELADPETKAGWLKALQMDPTLNDLTIKLRQNAQKEADTGKIGTSNNAIKTVLGHTGHLVDAYIESPDLGAGKGVNWLVGKAKELGPGGNPGLQMVYDLVEAIGPEMSKAYIPGQGTEGERHAWKERINPFRPDPERKASLNTFGEMLITKLNANEAQYRKAFKGLSDSVVPPPIQLDEDSYNALKKIEAYSGKQIKGAAKWMQRYEQGGDAAPTAPAVASQPAATAKPKLGAVVDGYVFLGGDPASPKSWKKQ